MNTIKLFLLILLFLGFVSYITPMENEEKEEHGDHEERITALEEGQTKFQKYIARLSGMVQRQHDLIGSNLDEIRKLKARTAPRNRDLEHLKAKKELLNRTLENKGKQQIPIKFAIDQGVGIELEDIQRIYENALPHDNKIFFAFNAKYRGSGVYDITPLAVCLLELKENKKKQLEIG